MRTFATPLMFCLAVAACSSADSSTTTCTVSAVAINGAPASVVVGANTTLVATVTQQNCSSNVITWSTSNAGVLSVDQTGKVTGVSAGGPVTITAATGGYQGTAQISVTAVPVASVTTAPDSVIVGVGATTQLAATTRAADNSVLAGRTIVWAPGAPATATISATGLVTGVAPGNTTVTATSETMVGTTKVFVATPRVVYLWNNFIVAPPTATAPTTGYSYNTNSGTNTITALGAGGGGYLVSYTGFGRTGAETEAVFVTGYGTPGTYCDVQSWGSSSANVYCYGTNGSLNNSQFNFLAVGSGTFGGRFASAWVNDPSPTAAYSPSSSYRFSSSNQPITVSKTATGVYSVLFAGQGRAVASDREALMVTAYSGNSVSCQLGGWTTTTSDLTATVYCFAPAGAPVDAQFTIGLVSQPRTGANVGYADADQPTAVAAYTPTNSKVLPAGTATVTRNGVGSYSVQFDGLVRSGALTESFQITSVGPTAVRCRVGSWGPTGLGVQTSVFCATPDGTAVDSRFVIVGVQ